MDTGKDAAPEEQDFSAIATWVTLAAIVVTLYLAIWQIDWEGNELAAVGFCLIVPGVVGGLTNAAAKAVRSSQSA